MTEHAIEKAERTDVGLGTKAPINTIAELLHAQAANLAAVAPRNFDMTTLVPKFLSRASRNPALLKCTPLSVYTTVHECVQLGLEPMCPRGHYYVIPRKNKHLSSAATRRAKRNVDVYEATGMLGYKGMIELARRSQQIKKIDCAAVYEGEEFEFDRGTGVISHPYEFGVDRSDKKLVGAYAYAELANGERVARVLDRAQIEARRERSMAKNDGPWVTDYEAMAIKSAVRALLSSGLVPMTEPLAAAIEREDERERQAAKEAEFVPVELPVLPDEDSNGEVVEDPLAENLARTVTKEQPIAVAPERAAEDLAQRRGVLQTLAESKGKSPKWLEAEAKQRFGRQGLSTCDRREIEELIEAVDAEPES